MNKRAFHAQRPLVVIACLFGVGVFIGGRWQGPVLWLPLCGAALSLLAAVCHKGFRVFACALAALFLGLLIASGAAYPLRPPAGEYLIQGKVAGLTERREPDGRTRGRLVDVVATDDNDRTYQITRVYWTYYTDKDAPMPVDGQQVSLRGRLYIPSGQLNPYGFDFSGYLLQQGISMGLSGAKELALTPPDQKEPASFWLRARIGLSKALDDLLKEDAGLSKALLLGERDDLADETTGAFRASGIAHILAVSGLHVSILSLWLLYLLRLLRVSPRARFVLMALTLLAYCRLLDFSAPVVRAAVLSVLMLGARLLFRRSDPLTSLSIAFILILTFRPLDLFSLGFQLSFMAVLGIFTLGDWLWRKWQLIREHRHALRRLDAPVMALQTTLAATAFTAPLSMVSFHQISIVGLIISPVACVIVGLLMPYGLMVLILGMLRVPYAEIIAWPVRWMSQALIKLASISASFPYGLLRTAAPALFVVLAMYLLLLMLSRYTMLKWRFRLLLPALVAVPAIAMALTAPHPPVRYMQLNAGNADAAIIEDGRSTYIIDAAEHGGDLASYLLSRGEQVEKLFITHLHMDHIGGLKQLLERGVPIQTLVLPYGALDVQIDPESAKLLDLAREKGIAVEYWAQGDSLASGRVSMRVLWPVRDRLYPGMDANNGSMAMLWQLDGVSLLTTGDLSGDYEKYASAPAQVLKVAHHGSGSSSSSAFLDAVRPQVALLSISGTQIGRISKAMARIQDAGCIIYETKDKGALMLSFSNGQISVEQFGKGGAK